MVRIGIEASERIGLACEAEGVAGPANVSATPVSRTTAKADLSEASLRLS